jgi:hypothetical protein
MDLGGLGKMLDPGSLISSAVKSFLPPQLQFLGGIAGAVADAQMGNPMGAIQNGMEAFQDLQQGHGAPGTPTNGSPSNSRTAWRAEPSPPPSLQSTTGGLTAATTGPGTGGPSPVGDTPPPASVLTHADAAAQTGFSRPGAPPPGAQQPSAPANHRVYGNSISDQAEHFDATVADLDRRVRNAAQTPQTDSAVAPASTTSASSAPAATQAAKSETTQVPLPPPFPPLPGLAVLNGIFGGIGGLFAGTKGQPVDPSKMTKDDFMALGNEAFMSAVRDGKIPKEVQDSPSAMQSLQARMNSISQMNQLMTSMLTALHQMQMSIIQNVRV